MAKHLIYANLEIEMDEMDGTPDESADVLLDLDLLDKIRKLCEREGYPARIEVEFAEEAY